MYGGGSRLGVGYDKSLLRDERDDSWNGQRRIRQEQEDSWADRFQGQDTIQKEFTASIRSRGSQASLDILGPDDGSFGFGASHPDILALGQAWDDTVTELADTVWQEDDEELTVALSHPPGEYRDWETDRKSTRLNSSHLKLSRMPSSA